ncbi:MAG TPA: nucleoside-diphosphate sugar epimerase/dehydratase, partial [Bacillota bacterium]|nr:nucleoside-diphosphate sugar epimerase/dehydratase [Bacillota bacterium]
RRIWAFAGEEEVLALTAWSLIAVIGGGAAGLVAGRAIPLTALPKVWVFVVALTGGTRLGWRIFHRRLNEVKPGDKRKPALIVGAGEGGAIMAREMLHSKIGLKPVGFVDDDSAKSGMCLNGIPVLGTRENIREICARLKVEEIIIAIPSASPRTLRELKDICKTVPARLRILPGVVQLLDGPITLEQLQEVKPEELLMRETVRLQTGEIADYIQGASVLVTGAGGSIGSELCRQIAMFSPNKLIVLGHGENSIYNLQQQLNRDYPELRVEAEIADIRHLRHLKDVFRRHGPDVVFHAAAHKHVPLMEQQPEEAFSNNVIGTRNTALAAHYCGSKIFVMISTDKAVNPVNVMGATKKAAEMLVRRMNDLSSTKFVVVRFGNVLGSRGSVVPLFKNQIARGGPITVTHPDVTRYFMTIREAVQLVLQGGAMATGGEIFVLDMGRPIKILDLANTLIRHSGTNKHIEVVFTGMRPGEKLNEELFTKAEGRVTTRHERIFVASPSPEKQEIVDRLIRLGQQPEDPDEELEWSPDQAWILLKSLVPTLPERQRSG